MSNEIRRYRCTFEFLLKDSSEYSVYNTLIQASIKHIAEVAIGIQIDDIVFTRAEVTDDHN